MKKAEQAKVNEIVNKYFNDAVNQLPLEARSYLNAKQMVKAGAKRLRSCSAYVWETPDYYVLQSYETFVACINKVNKITYDNLKNEFGRTHTSCMHIVKFANDYGNGNKMIAR